MYVYQIVAGIIEEVLLFPLILGFGEVIYNNTEPPSSVLTCQLLNHQCLIVTELVDWSVCEHNIQIVYTVDPR